VVLGLGNYQQEEVLSLRTSSTEVVAGELIQGIMRDLGTAGGHHMTAGGQIRPLAADRDVQRELEKSLTRRLLDELGRDKQRGRRLISD